MVGATGIEPVTPSMSTRCLKPNSLGLLEFLKRFVAFFAVCSRRIVAVRCRRCFLFSEAASPQLTSHGLVGDRLTRFPWRHVPIAGTKCPCGILVFVGSMKGCVVVL